MGAPTRTELRQAIRYARRAGDAGAVEQAEAALADHQERARVVASTWGREMNHLKSTTIGKRLGR